MTRKMMIRLAALVLMCCALSVQAKPVYPRHALKIGERVPDVVLSPMVNYKHQSARISDFSDKLLIIDFWATWCIPCIKAFPRMDSLQRQYNDRLQFLPISGEPESVVSRFFDRIRKQYDYRIPSAVDTVLYSHFLSSSGNFVGQYVWIRNGIIVGLTSGKEALTTENIQRVLSGKYLGHSPEDADSIDVSDVFDKAVLIPLAAKNTGTRYSSGFTPYIPGLRAAVHSKDASTGDNTSGLRIVNRPLAYMYFIAHGFPTYYQVIEEIADPDAFNARVAETRNRDLYCYERATTGQAISDLQRVFREDLQRVFGFVVSQQERIVPCLVLRKIQNIQLKASHATPYQESCNYFLTLQNEPFETLVSNLEHYMIGREIPFLIDETGIDQSVDMSLDCDLSDYLAVNKQLANYGLVLQLEARPRMMYVISDRVKTTAISE